MSQYAVIQDYDTGRVRIDWVDPENKPASVAMTTDLLEHWVENQNTIRELWQAYMRLSDLALLRPPHGNLVEGGILRQLAICNALMEQAFPPEGPNVPPPA
jgi:hypothetical protein